MKATTEQLVSALRVLSVEIHSEDGVANAVIAEAADRMTLLANLVAQHVQETKDDINQMAVASETMVEATAKIQSLRARINRLEDGILKQNQEIEQTCGKVLGYPWFKDDQKNFPGANEKDGVCVGEHVAETIVSELAKRHTEALARIKRLEEAGDCIAEENDIYIRRREWREAKEAKP